ncbi:pentatricopeptide repeat-containing protein At1g69290-like [Triticum urartu]|uniref:pentatricopeptide repeat-containing protein At1g69290-like n=1 Tax=Triticum urartu TaxID=4572 RepID=UPI0020441A9F|nr:pentatricopeptide repeat-containing protein At1g69290-like [Triticum urartu]XP_048564826.1 pentatricopeptide repeat-containing protein At1g69290-like [Triticum urartu]XP_048564827.1 pentatricopeptide repeat-containing protein At1g69290-like [Triticum urartu]XP_048564828.1 pentatricopeptide repeat-containing protein At1g69290-like [Triticum urartu]XP_048564829.1 pentatricopeptide repeat-containing protein At1g69290-like [Triticum urartu]
MRALLSVRLRRLLSLPLRARPPSSSSSSSGGTHEIPTLYSFLQPNIFAPRPRPQPPPPQPHPSPDPAPKALPVADAVALEESLLAAVAEGRSDDAWLAFKSLAAASLSPSPPAAAALVSHLVADNHRLGLKRAFAAAVFLLEKSPHASPLLEAALGALFSSLAASGSAAPALALARALLGCGRRLPAFSAWGLPLIDLTRADTASFAAFLKVFEEACKLMAEEKSPAVVAVMRPDLAACNAVLDGCCRRLGSVADAEKVLEIMPAVGVSPDVESFGHLAFLYAWRAVPSRVDELDKLLEALGFSKKGFFKNLVSGYLKSCSFESVSSIILRAVEERRVGDGNPFDDECYTEVAQCFVDNGRIRELAQLIFQAQEIELTHQLPVVDDSVGFGIVNACVGLGLLNKAHNILDEMTAQGASVGLAIYSPILKAYCKEQKTAEAAQLVAEISAAGLQLDAGSYDALIDASMTAHDFQSAFALFKDMREARLPDLRTSYLTIMTGLTENNRPELMASFLDAVVDDPRIEIATHDWNSIIHAFCKVGRLEDARRTYRRMLFLLYEPNNQTYLSLINGYLSAEKYFNVLILWTEVRRKGADFNHELIDAFLHALVKGGFFDMAMQVIEKAQELKIFVDKWRHKQAFMETHKKLKVAKLRKRNFRKMEALIAFKNWAGLNS